MDDALGPAGFPQGIHVDATLTVGALVGNACLGNAAFDGVSDQFFKTFFTGFAFIDLRNGVAVFIVRIGIYTPEKVPTQPAAAKAPALLPLDTATPLPPSIMGVHFTSRNENRFNGLHGLLQQ